MKQPCSRTETHQNGLASVGARLERLFVLACARWNARLTRNAGLNESTLFYPRRWRTPGNALLATPELWPTT
eukprot:11163908-Lingulodinium_polyedra.AAC.1